MKKPVLGIDVDGTLTKTMEVFLDRIKYDYGVSVTKEKITDYDLTKTIPLTKEQMHKAWGDVWETPEKIELYDEHVPSVLRILKTKFEIHIVTATNARHENLVSWLSDKKIPYDKIQRFDRQADKIKSKVDVHIDDNFEAVDMFVKENKKAILVSQPWNLKNHSAVNEQKLASTIKSWKEIEELFNQGKL